MAKRKSKQKTVLGRLISLVSALGNWAAGSGRGLVLSVLLIAILAAAVGVSWQKLSKRVLSGDDYIVSVEDLEITRQPSWIHTDIAERVFAVLRTSGGRLSIMEPEVAEKVSQAFASQPWVKRVLRVSKHHPARIRIELEYRRPVCMVMVKTAEGGEGLYPVDAEGVFLPTEDFTPLEARQYLWLIGFHTTAPVGGAGSPWGDERVVGGAEIAAALTEDRKELGLDRIEPVAPSRSAYHSVYSYVLFTHGGTKIIWGRPPGSELPSEATAADKIARLKEFIAVRGSFDASRSRLTIDVRSRDGLKLLDRMAMETPAVQSSPLRSSSRLPDQQTAKQR